MTYSYSRLIHPPNPFEISISCHLISCYPLCVIPPIIIPFRMYDSIRLSERRKVIPISHFSMQFYTHPTLKGW